MAFIRDILPRKWIGAIWSIRGDDYNTLVWSAENTVTKPTEEEIRAFSSEVDGIIEEENRQSRRGHALYDRQDALVDILWALSDAIDDIQGKLRAAALSSALDSNAENRIDTIRTRLAQIRAMT
jgi:hypothetical protein